MLLPTGRARKKFGMAKFHHRFGIVPYFAFTSGVAFFFISLLLLWKAAPPEWCFATASAKGTRRTR
eukprot:6471272-Amphidinium_carterae.1